jgi:hypothetical protein
LKGLDLLLAIGPTLTSHSILFELLQALRISMRKIIILRRIGPGIGGNTDAFRAKPCGVSDSDPIGFLQP